MVWTTLSLAVWMTDTSLVAVLVTNSAPFLAYRAVGCRPTSMLAGAAGGVAQAVTPTLALRGAAGEGAVRVHGDPAVAVGLAQPQLRTVRGVGGALLAHVVAADAQVRRGV